MRRILGLLAITAVITACTGCSFFGDMLATAGEMGNDPAVEDWGYGYNFEELEEVPDEPIEVDILTPIDFGLDGVISINGVGIDAEDNTSVYVMLESASSIEDFDDDFDVTLMADGVQFSRGATFKANTRYRIYFKGDKSVADVDEFTVLLDNDSILYPEVYAVCGLNSSAVNDSDVEES